MDSIGQKLKKTRIIKNLKISDVSKELRISEEILNNFEKDYIQKDIDPVFLIGHLRSYSSFLKLDQTKLVEQFKATHITVKKLNNSLFSASKTKLKNILNVTDEKLVSVDFNHNSASAIIDSSLTNVVGNKMGKISAWYDNEWGFSNRMCDIAEYVSKIK